MHNVQLMCRTLAAMMGVGLRTAATGNFFAVMGRHAKAKAPSDSYGMLQPDMLAALEKALPRDMQLRRRCIAPERTI